MAQFTSGVAPWHTLFPRPLQYRPCLGGKCRKLTPWNCESVGHVPVHQAKTSTACVISVIADPRTSDLSTINVWFPVAIIFFLDSSSQLQMALWKNIFYATGQHLWVQLVRAPVAADQLLKFDCLTSPDFLFLDKKKNKTAMRLQTLWTHGNINERPNWLSSTRYEESVTR